MSVVRQGTLGATRTCPHCKATVLQSANICPGCQHHLRFSAANSEPQSEGVPAMRIEGSIQHPGRGEACEYCVVVSITNEQGEKIARQVVGVGALQPGEKSQVQFFGGSRSGALRRSGAPRPGRRRRRRAQAQLIGRAAAQRSPLPSMSMKRRNSARVLASARNVPTILLVTIDTPRLCTPRVVMH